MESPRSRSTENPLTLSVGTELFASNVSGRMWLNVEHDPALLEPYYFEHKLGVSVWDRGIVTYSLLTSRQLCHQGTHHTGKDKSCNE